MSSNPILEARGVWKAFPGVQALADIALTIQPGAIHALMGENGAGKSTLARLLAGLDQPDRGRVCFRGRPVRLRHPHQALRLGIAMIHQELLPFPDLSVAQNILMGQEPGWGIGGWCVDRRRMHAEAARLLDRLGVDLSPTRLMRELSVAEMQSVEIAKALAHEAALIIMDEPTSSLSSHEVEALFRVIGDLTGQGVAVLYVSHKLAEVFRLADRVTVLRDGRDVGTHPAADLNAERLIALMVGRNLDPPASASRRRGAEPALTVRELSRTGAFQDVSFAVRRGEILGVGGLVGAGRTELLQALFGLAPADGGEIRVHGRVRRICSPRQALACGIALVSEDRKQEGLVLSMSVRENLTLASLRRCCRFGFVLDHRAEGDIARTQIDAFGIRPPAPERQVALLSGGNQQKAVIAKALLTDPEVLLLDEPTRGIDVAAKAEIHALVRRLASDGKAIVLVSSELPELLSLSDRLLVMREGRLAGELDARTASSEDVMSYAMLDGVDAVPA